MATSEPDWTNTANQHLSGHTSSDMCGYFNPTCLSRLLARKARTSFSHSTYCTWCRRYLIYASDDDWDELCWWIVTFSWRQYHTVCNSLVLLFQYLTVQFNCSRIYSNVSAYICYGTFCLFGPIKAAYLSQVLSDKFCPLHEHSRF